MGGRWEEGLWKRTTTIIVVRFRNALGWASHILGPPSCFSLLNSLVECMWPHPHPFGKGTTNPLLRQLLKLHSKWRGSIHSIKTQFQQIKWNPAQLHWSRVNFRCLNQAPFVQSWWHRVRTTLLLQLQCHCYTPQESGYGQCMQALRQLCQAPSSSQMSCTNCPLLFSSQFLKSHQPCSPNQTGSWQNLLRKHG